MRNLNIANMTTLIDHLTALSIADDAKPAVKVGFNMASWYIDNAVEDEGDALFDVSGNACGTNACIAGHCVLLQGLEFKRERDVWNDYVYNIVGVGTKVSTNAAEWLGLSSVAADRLFYGGNWTEGFNLRDVTIEDAIDECNRVLSSAKRHQSACGIGHRSSTDD